MSTWVNIGKDCCIHTSTNLYGCDIGDNCKIGAFVEIQKTVIVGKNCKISSHSFICEGVTIEDDVFIGHGVMFINDRYPRSVGTEGSLKSAKDWKCERTLIKKGASIGSNATIMCGVTIGEQAMIGAGALVLEDVPPRSLVVGVPGKVISRDISR